MNRIQHSVKLADGEIRLWIDQGHVLCIHAVAPSGDPVELSENEADELISALQRLRAAMDR